MEDLVKFENPVNLRYPRRQLPSEVRPYHQAHVFSTPVRLVGAYHPRKKGTDPSIRDLRIPLWLLTRRSNHHGKKMGGDSPTRLGGSPDKVGHCSLMVSDSTWLISSAAGRGPERPVLYEDGEGLRVRTTGRSSSARRTMKDVLALLGYTQAPHAFHFGGGVALRLPLTRCGTSW